MTALEVYRYLDKIAPFASALGFDNPGLLVGDPAAVADTVLLTLDCTHPAVCRAREIGAKVIVTHHPVIFEPLKAVTARTVVYELAQSGITVISAHTNLDFAAGGVCDTLCAAVGLSEVTVANDGLHIGNTGPVPVEEFAAHVAMVLHCRPRYTAGNRPVRVVAVCSGSGGSYLEAASELGCDTLLTGDVKYSAFISAANLGMNLIDAGHFETEQIILPRLQSQLSEAFPGLKTEIFDCNPIRTF